jgi:putative peptide maturation system protein
MRETVEQTVIDTLDYLMTIVREETSPETAKSGLRPLQRKHSAVGMQLLWEEETYDRRIHYDALLNLPEEGTISISFCDHRATPWPLRGVHRWSDADLVRVNDNVLSVDQAIACLDFMWDEARIAERLVNICLVQNELSINPIDLSDEEFQSAMDGFRRARGLFKAEDTRRWMERRGLTHQELEILVTDLATVAKLRDRLVGNRVEEYFKTHSADFDIAHIARIVLSDISAASVLADQIRCGYGDFFNAAQDVFTRSGQPGADLFVAVRRRDAADEIRDALFQSPPGSVLGPVRDGDRYAIVRVLSTTRARLDKGTRETIENILFDEWLEERRQKATIEWFWGTASKTDRSSRLSR